MVIFCYVYVILNKLLYIQFTKNPCNKPDASTTLASPTTASSPNATVLRSASTPPKVATGNSQCELLGEACNNGVLASRACRVLMTSTLGSSTKGRF